MNGNQIFNNLRALRTLVIHPPDTHAEVLVAHLSRIGCRTETLWPAPPRLPPSTDILFLAVAETMPDSTIRMLNDPEIERPTLIGLAGYENPSVLQTLLDLCVEAVITKPLRPYGVLTSLVMARRIWEERRRLDRKVQKLDEKVKNQQKVNRAKFILMNLHHISEDDAYRMIRTQAMAKRATTAEIAQAIINADGILGNISSRSVNDG